VEHGGRVLAYSGDTDACPALEELAKEADLLLAEASFQEDRDEVRGIHLTGRRAGEAAAAAGARRLVLTHIPVWTDVDVVLEEARGAYAGPVEPARPGAVHEV
jgi:ribonuclease BN (tRNA processing enzyme)